MSSILDRFKKTTIGNVNKDVNYEDILLPSSELSRHEGISAIIKSWRNILRTPEGTADHDPEYGTKLSRYIFEPADEETVTKIKDEIRNKLMRYDDRASISSINVFPLNSRKGYTISIRVRYKGEENDLTVDVDESLVS